MLNLLKFSLIIFTFLSLFQKSWASICEPYIQQQEVLLQIPSHLLKAIAHIESGRLISPSKVVAWPWTINVNGKGYVYPTKQAAIMAVKKFQENKNTSIDVGCMQINLKHHPHAFRNLSDAFDPQLNVAYAAQFLKGLKEQHGSWHNAVAHYHSATPKYHNPYRQKVATRWQKIRKQNGNPASVWQDLQFLSMSPISPAPMTPQPIVPSRQILTSQHQPMQHSQQQARVQTATYQQPVQEESEQSAQRVQFPVKFIPLNAHVDSGSGAVVTNKRFYPLNTTGEVSQNSGRVFYKLN